MIPGRSIFTLNDLRSAFERSDARYPTVLSTGLYDRAEAEGFNMTGYVRAGNARVPERKHISERTCHGKDVACLPGRGGDCVACFEED